MSYKKVMNVLKAMENNPSYCKKIDTKEGPATFDKFICEMKLQEKKCSQLSETEPCSFFGERNIAMLSERLQDPKAKHFIDIIDEDMQKLRGTDLWDRWYESMVVAKLNDAYSVSDLKKIIKHNKALLQGV